MSKTCIVTGGSHGIGRGIARVLAQRGYDLVLAHCQDGENAVTIQTEIQEELHRQCFLFEGDLVDVESAAKLVTFAVDRLGTVDALINNAGVTIYESALTATVKTMDHLFGLNYRAPMLLTRAMAEHMIAQHVAGNIVNIASIRGLRVYAGDAVYAGIKAALVHSMQASAIDLAPYHIRVNCIAPGGIPHMVLPEYTPNNPLGRMGAPGDIGHTVAWLLSDQAAHITGATIVVDGGETLLAMPANAP